MAAAGATGAVAAGYVKPNLRSLGVPAALASVSGVPDTGGGIPLTWPVPSGPDVPQQPGLADAPDQSPTPGPNGQPGTSGANGQPGTTGSNGQSGAAGANGQSAAPGQPTQPGPSGASGTSGIPVGATATSPANGAASAHSPQVRDVTDLPADIRSTPAPASELPTSAPSTSPQPVTSGTVVKAGSQQRPAQLPNTGTQATTGSAAGSATPTLLGLGLLAGGLLMRLGARPRLLRAGAPLASPSVTASSSTPEPPGATSACSASSNPAL
ncbi:MAG: hypothetical protein JO057_28290 [Chloroflexi bacterium]|nr:hypothetical protein [Chloroflexota bacterium]